MINILLALSLCADWSPRLAADYLDGRQKEWFAWKAAETPGGPCVSCHTGVTYLLVRPELRRKLGDAQPTIYETGLRKSLLGVGFAGALASHSSGVQAIHSAIFLGNLDRMWSLQNEQGAWQWFHLDLDPWETPESTFYGATLAALAVGKASPSDREKHREQIARLEAYLRREQAAQPLHNRLMLLWAMPEILPDRQALTEEVWKAQQPDGGWSIESLGPWKRPSRSSGSDAYATGLAAYVLLNDHNPSNKRPYAALNWLKSHQNPDGSWTSESMNKQYPPGSMMAKFMQDAGTSFAALALLESER